MRPIYIDILFTLVALLLWREVGLFHGVTFALAAAACRWPRPKPDRQQRPWLLPWRTTMATAALLCVWLSAMVYQVHRQRRGIEAIEAVGATFEYDYERQGELEPPGPRWLRRIVGDDFFTSVTAVRFWDPETSDGDLRHLANFPKLELVRLEFTANTDGAVEHLKRMKGLKTLQLRGSQISREAQRELQLALPECVITRHDPAPGEDVAT